MFDEKMKVILYYFKQIEIGNTFFFSRQLLFMAPEGQTFWDTFAGHLEKFKEDTKHLSDDSKLRLTEHPSRNRC